MTNVDHPRFRIFIAELQAAIESSHNEAEILQAGSPLLRDLVSIDDWLPDAYAEADPVHYRQYLLHVDPEARFSVVSFVWGPGQKTPIHNHTVWGIIGMLRGAEHEQHYRRREDGSLEAEHELVLLSKGNVDAVSPDIGDLHSVANAFQDRSSISIHVYGADIGKVERSVFQLDGTAKKFISGYSNA